MRRFLPNVLIPTAAMALVFTLTPRPVTAQQETQSPQCTATADPQEVMAGEPAARVQFTLSEMEGNITELIAPEGSGLTLASPGDLPKDEMANPMAPRRPIKMSGDYPNVVILWLNTKDATAGDRELTLRGENGSCVAHVTVKEGGSR